MTFSIDFFQSIEEDNRMKHLGRVVQCFVGLWNDNWSGHLEMQWPVTKIDACISDVDNIG